MKNGISQICPKCGLEAIPSRKWSKNKYGKKYEYLLFSHNNIVHRINSKNLGNELVGRHQLKKDILELVHSTSFRRAVFTSSDISNALHEKLQYTSHYNLYRALNSLVNEGMLQAVRNGTHIHYVNSTGEDRLNYILEEISINLEDSTNDGTFRKHLYTMNILNDKHFPIHYFQYRAFGDEPIDKQDLGFVATDVTKGENAKVHFLEDSKMEKRVVIELSTPIKPSSKRVVQMDYNWSEAAGYYSFTASTVLRSLKFSLTSLKRVKMSVTLTNEERTATEELSSFVRTTIDNRGWNVTWYDAVMVPPFEILTFKWYTSGN